MKNIFLVGNPLVDEDSTPLSLKPLLQKKFPDINFTEFDPSEELPDNLEHFCLIDTVKGIDEPRIFNNVDEFLNKKAVSMHDFDLGWTLKLYKKTGKLKQITIIGIPYNKKPEEIFEKLIKIVSAAV